MLFSGFASDPLDTVNRYISSLNRCDWRGAVDLTTGQLHHLMSALKSLDPDIRLEFTELNVTRLVVMSHHPATVAISCTGRAAIHTAIHGRHSFEAKSALILREDTHASGGWVISAVTREGEDHALVTGEWWDRGGCPNGVVDVSPHLLLPWAGSEDCIRVGSQK